MKIVLPVIFVGLLAATVWVRTRTDEGEIGSARLQQAVKVEQAKAVYPSLAVRSLGNGLPDKGEWRGKPVLRDLDGDGHTDVVTSIRRFDKNHIADGIHVFLGDGKGNWTPCDAGLAKDMGYGGVDAADLTGDGRPDLIYSGHDLPPRAFANFLEKEGQREWVAMDSVPGLESISCSDVALGDFDMDGDMDLAVMGFFPKTGGLYVMTNKGNGEFDSKTELMPIRDYGAIVRFVDLDGDGRVELIAATSVGAKVFAFVDGKWADQSLGLPETFDLGQISGIVRGIAAKDLDGDGKAEIVVSNLPTEGHPPVRIYRRDGERWVQWGRGLPDQESCFDVVFARLADGANGMFLAGQHGVLVVSVARDGQCDVRGRIDNTAGVLNVGAGDVDGDQVDEVLVINQRGLQLFAIPAPTSKERDIHNR